MPNQDRILCLGNNTEDTDKRANELAQDLNLTNHGLITDGKFIPVSPGVYHTSIADISIGEIIKLSRYFNLIKMFDQPAEEWTHKKLLQNTIKTMMELDRNDYITDFKNNSNIKFEQNIDQMVIDNPSWCIYPWINLMSRDETGLKLCARSNTVISDEFSIDAWKKSPKRIEIKQHMLQGKRMPEHCSTCYEYEDLGIESYRQYESREWLNYLNIDSIDQLESIIDPIYYEIHWSNKCNLKCRGCVPSRSSAIEKEFRQFNISPPFIDSVPTKYPGQDIIDIPGLSLQSRVYISGGEPLIMPELIDFMQECLQQDRTNFELTMSVNGVKIPQKFIDLSRHFPKLNLSFSLDGYDKINDYWRSGSQWDKIVKNMHSMKDLGHQITVNTVPGIYNVTNLHLLFEWLDREFPLTSVYLQINHNRIQSAYNHPDSARVIESMRRCQQTTTYWSDGKSCKSGIDSIYNYYITDPGFSHRALKDFFDYNDKLDKIRGVKLKDYIPELEACRSLVH